MKKVYLNELFTRVLSDYTGRTGEEAKRWVMPDENAVYLMGTLLTHFDDFIKDKVSNDDYEAYKHKTEELFVEGDRNYDKIIKSMNNAVASFHNTMDTNPHVIDVFTERYPIIGFNSPLDDSYTCMTNVYAYDVVTASWKEGDAFQVGMFNGIITNVVQEDKYQWKLTVDWNEDDIEMYKKGNEVVEDGKEVENEQ